MAGSFMAKIDAWVAASRQRREAVIKNAAAAVVEEIIDRTPFITGFLRATLTASLDGPLPMRDARPPGALPDSFERPTEYSLVIESAEPGQPIWVTFSANYAAHVEYGTKTQNPAAMVRLAAQNWPHHVATQVRRAKAAVADRSPGSARP